MNRKELEIDPKMIKEISTWAYEIPICFIPNMKVPGGFYATSEMAQNSFKELEDCIMDRNKGPPSIMQNAFVSTLDLIVKGSYGMPDMYSCYGFSIGEVAAFDTSDPDAIISPAWVGYDINCGVCCVATNLTKGEVIGNRKELINALFESIPTGVWGKKKRFLKKDDINEVLSKGAVWALEQGYTTEEDIENCEDNSCVSYSDPSVVSIRARQRCFEQLGSLGLSGNHYVEIQSFDEIFDEEIANIMF